MPVIVSLQRANYGPQFRAFGLRGAGRYIDPFMNVDHAWMSGPTFPPHSHAGFAAISYVFLDSESAMANRDSTGLSNVIKPGGVHWLQAGRGVVHEEVPAIEGKTVHSLQIFVQVPPLLRSAPPSALSVEPHEVPTISLPGVKLRVVAGEFEGRRPPGEAPADVDIFDVSLDVGAEFTMSLKPGRTTFFLPVHGSVKIAGDEIGLEDLTALVIPAGQAVKEVTLRAQRGAAKFMVFSGVPYQ